MSPTNECIKLNSAFLNNAMFWFYFSSFTRWHKVSSLYHLIKSSRILGFQKCDIFLFGFVFSFIYYYSLIRLQHTYLPVPSGLRCSKSRYKYPDSTYQVPTYMLPNIYISLWKKTHLVILIPLLFLFLMLCYYLLRS